MKRLRSVEIIVGLFVLLACAAFLFLIFRVSGLAHFSGYHSYYLTADFDNIGSLRVRAPVSIAGVNIGEVTDIKLDQEIFVAQITMKINNNQDKIPLEDTSASILTEGLLGSNYVNIAPGYYEHDDEDVVFLQDGDRIEQTQQALILENLIGQFLFSMNQ